MANFHSVGALLLLVFAMIYASETKLPHLLSDAFIDMINEENSTWTKGRNFAEDTSMDYIKLLVGGVKKKLYYTGDKSETYDYITYDSEFIKNLPTKFDPRDKWVECPGLNEIIDQGACSSCWAVSIAATLTDRICIHSNGTKKIHVSAQDLLRCSGCTTEGCKVGGDVDCAWKFWVKNGIVSGGPYNSSEGCKPYEIKPCEHMFSGEGKSSCILDRDDRKCVKHCRTGYNISYQEDENHGHKIFAVKGEDNIKAELFKNGPLLAVMVIYEDFLVYKHGIYRHKIGKEMGYHAVKLMGWGIENGTKYWLLANTWNTDFGENGFFRIVRGENNSEIEQSITAAYV